MLRLTRTAIGLLTAQYRSVLKKCWAINVGIFALGAMAATVPTTAESASIMIDSGETKNFSELAVSSGDQIEIFGTLNIDRETSQNGVAVRDVAFDGFGTVNINTNISDYLNTEGIFSAEADFYPNVNLNGKTLISASSWSVGWGGYRWYVNTITGGGNFDLGGYTFDAADGLINASSSSNSGTYTITKVGSLDRPSSAGTYKYVILNAAGTTLALGGTAASYSDSWTKTSTSSDSIAASTDWSTTYYKRTTTTPLQMTLSVDNSDSAKKYLVRNVSAGNSSTSTSSLGDTLKLVNQDTTNSPKTFSTTQGTSGSPYTYEAGVTPGTTYGSLTVQGASPEGSRINLKGKTGFDLSQANSSLTLENMLLYNAGSYAVKLSNSSATLNVNGARIRGSSFDTVGLYGITGTAGTVNFTGDNYIVVPVTFSGTKNVNGGITYFYSTIAGLNVASGATAAIFNAADLTAAATNNGTLQLAGTLNQAISGSGKTEACYNVLLALGANASLTNQTLNLNGKTLTPLQGAIKAYTVARLIGTGNLVIDVDGTSSADKLTATGSNSYGTYTITELNAANRPTAAGRYEYTILDLAGGTAKLALSDAIANETYGGGSSVTKDEDIAANTDWDKKYYNQTIDSGTSGVYSVDNSTNAKKLIYTVTAGDGTPTNNYELGDTLKLVNQDTTNSTKTFSTTTQNKTYTVTENLGTTKGTLTVSGVKNTSKTYPQYSLIELDGHTGFDLSQAATLNLNNVSIRDKNETTNSYAVNLTNANAVLNLNNFNIETATKDDDGAALQVKGTAGTINLTGTNHFEGPVNFSGIFNVNEGLSTIGDSSFSGGTVKVANDAILWVYSGRSGNNLGKLINNNGQVYLNLLSSLADNYLTVESGSSGSIIVKYIYYTPSSGQSYSILTGAGANTANISSSTSGANGAYLVIDDSLKSTSTAAGAWVNPTITSTAVDWDATLQKSRTAAKTTAGYDYGNTAHTAIKRVAASGGGTEYANYDGDKLAYVNKYQTSDAKTFSTTQGTWGSPYTYEAKDTPGATYGSLTVQGASSGGSRINLKGNTGFNLSNSSTSLTLKDMALYNAGSYAVNLSNSSATLNVNGAYIGGSSFNSTGSYGITGSAGTVNFTGNNYIYVPVTFSGTKNVNSGSTSFYSTIAGLNVAGGATAYIYNAANLTAAATNNGRLILAGTLNQTISGNGTISSLDFALGANASLTNQTLDLNSKTLTPLQGAIKAYTVARLIGGGNLVIDVDGTSSADKLITTGSDSHGTYTITELNAANQPTAAGRYEYIILDLAGGTAKLALSDAIANETYGGGSSVTKDEDIAANTDWDKKYYNQTIDSGTSGVYSVDNSTIAKKLIYTVTSGDGTPTNNYELGDTLNLINQYVSESAKTFSTTDATKVYSATLSPGITRGTVNIQGARSGDNISTIDLNGYEGFMVDSDATLNITDVKLINGAKSASTTIGGGAINNQGTITTLNGTFTGNYAETSGTNAYGGGIANDKGKIGSIEADFTGNYAKSTGEHAAGAGTGGVSSDTDDDQGSGRAYGGAIFNLAQVERDPDTGEIIGVVENTGVIDSIVGNFTNNYVYSENGYARGGAIYNEYGTIGQIGSAENKALFENNRAESVNKMAMGGAIYNGGTIGQIGSAENKALFENNRAESVDGRAMGGAINNNLISSIIDKIYADFKDNYVTGNKIAFGAAIYNKGNIGDIVGNFQNNKVSAIDQGKGGAIYSGEGTESSKNIRSIIGNFINNSADSVNSYAQGGAIFAYNNSSIGTIKGDFIGNYVQTTSSRARGGAIYNTGLIGTLDTETGKLLVDNTGIVDSSFTGNYILGNNESNGGAIFNNNGNINLSALQSDVNFWNNKTNDRYNDIYNAGSRGTMNFNAAQNRTMSFGGSIEGDGKGTININTGNVAGGTYVFKNSVSGNKVVVGSAESNYAPASLSFEKATQEDGSPTNGTFDVASLTINGDGNSLSTRNDKVDTNSATTLTLNNALNLQIDGNLQSGKGDSLAATSFVAAAPKSLRLTAMNFTADPDVTTLSKTDTLDVDISDGEIAPLDDAYTLASTNPADTTEDQIEQAYLDNLTSSSGNYNRTYAFRSAKLLTAPGGGSYVQYGDAITLKWLYEKYINGWSNGNYILNNVVDGGSADTTHLTVGQALTALDSAIGKNFTDSGFRFTPKAYYNSDGGTLGNAKLNILKDYNVATNGVTGALARLDYELSNNYYEKL